MTYEPKKQPLENNDFLFSRAPYRNEQQCYARLVTEKPRLDGLYNPQYSLVEPRPPVKDLREFPRSEVRSKVWKIPECLKNMEFCSQKNRLRQYLQKTHKAEPVGTLSEVADSPLKPKSTSPLKSLKSSIKPAASPT